MTRAPLKYFVELNPEVLPETTPPDFEFQYIDIGAVDRRRTDIHSERLRFDRAPSRARRRVRAGDVLVSTVRTYLRAVAYVPPEMDGEVCSTGFAVLRPTKRVVGSYLYFLATSPQFIEQVVARSTGVSYPAINARDLARIAVPVPDLERQKAIAGFLDGECGRIEELRGELRAFAGEARRSFFEDSFRTLCAGEQSIPLKYLIEAQTNGAWGVEPGAADVDCACIRVADFDRRSLTVAEAPTVRGLPYRQASRLNVRPDDLLLEKSGGGANSPVGFVVRYTGSAQHVVCSNFIARIRSALGVDPVYLTHVFGALYFTRRNEPFVKQVTGIQNLDTSAYLNLKVPDVSAEEQRRLGRARQAKLESTLALEEELSGAQLALDAYRDALITEAVAGRLDLSNMSDSRMEESLAAVGEGEKPEVLS